MRVESQPAYLLHTRPYRDSSLLVELLTVDFGRVSAIAKGIRGGSKTAGLRRGQLQLFSPLLVNWGGRSELKSLHQFESRSYALPLQGKSLFSGLYINELLTRLLTHADRHPEIFTLYEWAIKSLSVETTIDIVLRKFELRLLEQLGYGLDLRNDCQSLMPVAENGWYRLQPDQGLTKAASGENENTFWGGHLLQLAAGEFTDENRQAAKRFCRMALAPHLGDRPLRSRELFLSAMGRSAGRSA